MSSTERRHEKVLQTHKRTRPNQRLKAKGREAAKRRAEAVEAALARLEECGVITTGSVK